MTPPPRFYHWKFDFLADFGEIPVPFGDLRLTGGEMRAQKAERGRMEDESNRHAPFIPSGPAQARLHRIGADVANKLRQMGPNVNEQTNADQLDAGQHHVFMGPANHFFQFLRPHFLIGGTEKKRKFSENKIKNSTEVFLTKKIES